jgi:hypothetical protein
MADYRNQGILNTDGSGTVNIGLSDNNPGDIKFDGTDWKGSAGNDGTFVIFSDTTWGLRAVALDLTSKISRDGLNTITLIVNKYAPSSDSNDVGAYIASLVSDTGFGATQVLTADAQTLASLIRAVVNHEIGDTLSQQYVPDADIQTALSMTGVVAATAQQANQAAQNSPGGTLLIITAAVGLGIWLTK